MCNPLLQACVVGETVGYRVGLSVGVEVGVLVSPGFDGESVGLELAGAADGAGVGSDVAGAAVGNVVVGPDVAGAAVGIDDSDVTGAADGAVVSEGGMQTPSKTTCGSNAQVRLVTHKTVSSLQASPRSAKVSEPPGWPAGPPSPNVGTAVGDDVGAVVVDPGNRPCPSSSQSAPGPMPGRSFGQGLGLGPDSDPGPRRSSEPSPGCGLGFGPGLALLFGLGPPTRSSGPSPFFPMPMAPTSMPMPMPRRTLAFAPPEALRAALVSKRVPAFTDSLASEPQCPMVTSTTAINGINVRRDIVSLCCRSVIR